MTTLFSVLVLISSITLIVSVAFQQSNSDGMSATMSGNAETIFGKTRGRGKDFILKRITIISSAVFMISTIVLAAL